MKGRTTIAVISCVLLLAMIVLVPNVTAQEVVIPSWIKNNAGWWASDQIPDSAFLQGIQYIIKEGIMVIPYTETSESSGPQEVPSWVKNNAGWWADGQINDNTFVSGIQYLIKSGIIVVTQAEKVSAEMWINGHITDDEFLTSIENLIETKSSIITDNSISKMSQLPDWLVNNAGWWAARILTNSDFDFDHKYVKEEIYPCKEDSSSDTCFKKTYNSIGLRGSDINSKKPDNTYRIFAVGGSTTFGNTSDENETWPAYLQQIINEKITDKKIEVINAGVSGGTSKSEYDLIKNKLLSFDPDLIITYDGWNDSKQTSVKTTIQNWNLICKLGNNEGFDTIIIVQPLVLTGNRVLTEQESETSFHHLLNLPKFQQYVDAFEELDKVCSKTVDFRGIFDYVQEPIFYDIGHTTSFGNKIIAENVFSVISPNFGKTYSAIHNNLNSENNEPETGVVYAVGSDLSGRNFDNLNLQNAVFDRADLSNTSFKNANIDGARFVFANLNSSTLLERMDLSNINLAGANLSNTSLKGKNLSGTILTGADLSNSILTGSDLSDMDLTGTILTGADLSNAILVGTNLQYASLERVNMKNVDFTSADLTSAKFKGTNISMAYLSTMNLREADLSGAILTGADLSGMDLTGTKLRDVDLSGKDLTGTILTGADLTNSNLTGVDLSGKNFEYTIFDGVDLSGKDLSASNFPYASFNNADLKNVDFSSSFLIQVDFTKIKNKSLAGAYFRDTSFAYSNLSGVNLTGVTLDNNNFYQATLSGLDFTVISNGLIKGATFSESDLSNSNFEGVSLFDDRIYIATATGQAQKVDRSFDELTREFFPDYKNRWVVGLQAIGNDLLVQFIFFNNFNNATLQNVNFSNADLRYASFGNVDLTTANLENCVGHLICD